VRHAPLLAAAAVVLAASPAARADEVPEKYRKTVEKGLEWLAKQQERDGSWSVNNGQYPVAITALAGSAFLMEGSTPREGKYARNVRRAADFLLEKTRRENNKRDGLIGNVAEPQESSRYIFGHGYGMAFLAAVYGEEDDRERRERVREVLTRGVKFAVEAQTTRGGWFYTSKVESNSDMDEGATTFAVLQGLKAARNVGIAVPRETLKKASRYVEDMTSPKGVIYYSLQSKSERPALTAAALAVASDAADYNSPAAKKWWKACREQISLDGRGAQAGHDDYTQYYYAQAVYRLGDDGWERLFGPTPAAERITWSRYRDVVFDRIARAQAADGSWPAGTGFSVGAVYSTALHLTILQLDRQALPLSR
jgi:hypothetical protein